MEPVAPTQATPQNTPPVCSYCHQALMPSYYFCPNCGNKVQSAPLSTSVLSQTWLYVFSAILPVICYLAVSKWQGVKYLKSADQKTRIIGITACVILFISSIITFWYGYVWVENYIQSSLSSVNSDMSGIGNF